MNKLEALKCIEVTSQRQADNGTISYYDPQTKATYNIYENGYVRRTLGRFRLSSGHLSREYIYQLNPKRKEEHTFNRHDGKSYACTSTVRVMLNTHQERMDCAARAVVNFRNNSNK